MNWKKKLFNVIWSIPIIPIFLIGLPFYYLELFSYKIHTKCQHTMDSYANYLKQKEWIKRIYESCE